MTLERKLIRPAGSYLRLGRLKVFEIILVLVLQFLRVRFPTTFLVGVLIETLCIPRISYWWDNWTLVFSIVYVIPLYSLEKWMRFDPCGASLNVAKAMRSVNSAKLKNYIFRFVGEVRLRRKVNRFGNNPEKNKRP
jgi:hypothetical protein